MKPAARVANLTVVAPLKNVPVIVTELPDMPDAGVNEVIVGGMSGVTVNDPGLITVPAGADVFVTLTRPLVAGCGQEICNWVAV